MKHSANEGISEEEVIRRDRRIAETLACIEELEQRFSIGLYPGLYENLLEPGISRRVIIEGKQVFGEAWLDKALNYAEKLLLDHLANEVLKGIEARSREDQDLCGSAWMIARRLCLGRYAGYYHETERYEFDCNVSALRIGLDDVIELVQERLVERHMLYRLWDEGALEQLEQYLYYAVYDSEIFIEGALSTGVYGRAANVQDFLAGVDEAIANLPVVDMYECRFPDNYPEQILFSEYVPAPNMTAAQIERLYHSYLARYATEHDITVGIDTSINGAVSILLGAVDQAQAIVASWSVPEGIAAEQAMHKLVPVLDNRTVMQMMRELGKVPSVSK